MMQMRIGTRCQVLRKQFSKTLGHRTRLERSFDFDLLARATVLILHTVPLLCVQRSASDLEEYSYLVVLTTCRHIQTLWFLFVWHFVSAHSPTPYENT